jgi:hypothetical protein
VRRVKEVERQRVKEAEKERAREAEVKRAKDIADDEEFHAQQEEERQALLAGQSQYSLMGQTEGGRLDMDDGAAKEEAQIKALERQIRTQKITELRAALAASEARVKDMAERAPPQTGLAQKKQKIGGAILRPRQGYPDSQPESDEEEDTTPPATAAAQAVAAAIAAGGSVSQFHAKEFGDRQAPPEIFAATDDLFGQVRELEASRNSSANDASAMDIMSAFNSVVRQAETAVLAGIMPAFAIMFDGRPHTVPTPEGTLADAYERSYDVFYRLPVEHEIVLMARDESSPLPSAGNRPGNPFIWLQGSENVWYRCVAAPRTGVTLRHCKSIWAGASGQFKVPWNKMDECRVLLSGDSACFLSPRGPVLEQYNKNRPLDHPYPATPVAPGVQEGRRGGQARQREPDRGAPRFGGPGQDLHSARVTRYA